jgi:hypothetical protein
LLQMMGISLFLVRLVEVKMLPPWPCIS